MPKPASSGDDTSSCCQLTESPYYKSVIPKYRFALSITQIGKVLNDPTSSRRAYKRFQLIKARFGDPLEASKVSKQPRFQLVPHSPYRCKLALEITQDRK